MWTDQASIDIAAPAEWVYDIVADVASTGDRSPECRRVAWLDERARPVVGARFKGRSRWRGFSWWREVDIVRADRGREFAVEIKPGRAIYHDTTIWRYRFEPTGVGTRVVESYEFQAPWWIRTMDRLRGRPKALHHGMGRTLANLKGRRGAPRPRRHGRTMTVTDSLVGIAGLACLAMMAFMCIPMLVGTARRRLRRGQTADQG